MTHSVYVIEWPGRMVKPGYTGGRRWQALAKRHGGQVRGVWHFPDAMSALNAESLSHAAARHWGDWATPDDLDGSGGYVECRILRGTAALIAELLELLDACGSRCTEPEWCGLLASECTYSPMLGAVPEHRSSTAPSNARTYERTYEAGGEGRWRTFGSSAREIRGLK